MSRDIDISLIRTFLAVAENSGMTRAAQSLNLTQGAVSQQIKRLEAFFSKPLFDRRQKQMQLTPDGEKLVASANRLLALNDEVLQLMRQPEFTGEILLGVPPDIVRPFLPPILRRFNREYPSIRVTLISDATPVLLEMLKKKEIDLTLTTESIQGRQEEHLLTDALVWIGAPNGEACHRNPLPVALGLESCGFRASAAEALNRAGLEWVSICQVGSIEPVIASLEADMAIAPYMSQVIPETLSTIEPATGLPALPRYYINLRMPNQGTRKIVKELAQQIRNGFAMRYPAP
ncbi:LysR family transcriptional regulator [Sedimenticola selenatireducens]|uniref:LysR family transcriptional regulator n=1 Tax=Sedimenticola selenatireducens TaxID=191960 RepID=A0A558DW22_9GAMM|nr:LysR family transcriptional regulator [Sedimenticola selenatireducens]TVO77808.1 LysR family transcriptional regulator [Sedimenticola selenatireducens]TVT65113.1 MAG: LysR family transcriptional regulator [Sedimenticola selenatireducens]